MRELQLSSSAIWQMIYLRMVFTNPNKPVCGSIVSLLIMQLSWLNPTWLTQGYQQHSTIGCLKLEQHYGKGCAKFIVPLPILSIFLEFDVSFSFSSWFYSLQIFLGCSPFISTLTCSSDGTRMVSIQPWDGILAPMVIVFSLARSLLSLMKFLFLLGNKASFFFFSAGQLYDVTSSFVDKEFSQFLT